ncbi:MAG: LysM peptidoglycan-binding domain-containing protein [Anaerolineae bacterium]|nr:LysM peptidoglycan-binding domain-containing protein [Anaerolineae bacterium]
MVSTTETPPEVTDAPPAMAFVASPTATETATNTAVPSNTPTLLTPTLLDPTVTYTATSSPTETLTKPATATRIHDLGIITATPLIVPSDAVETGVDNAAFLPTSTEHPLVVMIPHTVEVGETLILIARRFNTTVEAIIAANALINPDNIQAGQTLLIPFTPEQVAMRLTSTASAQEPTATETNLPTETDRPTETDSPTATAMRTATKRIPMSLVTATRRPPLPTSTPRPTNSPTPPPPTDINGIQLNDMLVMSDVVKKNVRDIYACGIKLGNNLHAFAKLGDCNFEPPWFFTKFDTVGAYNLGAYSALQDVVDLYAGSFARNSVGVHRGMHSWSMWDPMWADKTQCEPNETVIACEFRITRPTIVLIRLGTNDGSVPQFYEKNMRKVVEFAIAHGAIPILGTKADRVEGGSDTINTMTRQIALDYNVPLWDFDLVASTLPSRGLDQDGIHMTVFPANDYSTATAFRRGHGVQNLSALMVLEAVRNEAISASGNAVATCGEEVKP